MPPEPPRPARRAPHRSAAGGDTEVLIVGAGPVGLTLAHELARRRVRVRVVDRAAGPATTSRALAVHPRTLEVTHQMGLADALLAHGQRVTHFTLHLRGRELIHFDANYANLPTCYPFSLMLDQVRTEQILRDRLAGLGVGIEWGVELTGLRTDGERVTARLRHGTASGRVAEVEEREAGGEAGVDEEAEVPWLVGADGSRSTVREELRLRLVGDATRTWLNADVVLDTDLPRDSNHLLHTGSGTVLLVPFPDPGKWRVVDTEETDGAADTEAVRRRLGAKISRALGRPVAVGVPTWVSVFRVQQRMITAMRSGRCFVAGDAAHVHSPASGQGMNTGMQDAYNLAWKLADVVRGHAREALLDSYAAERIPVGGRLLSSTRKATALVALRNAAAPVLMPVGLTALKALRPVKRRVEHRIMAGLSGLALQYADGPLSPAPAGGTDRGLRPGHRVGCTARDEANHPGWRALRAALTDPRWTLLLFPADPAPPGHAPTGHDAPDRHVADRAVRAQLTRHFGRAVGVRCVHPGNGERCEPDALPDPDGALRRGLGVPPGGYALIRPDGYLAAKGPYAPAAAVGEVLRGLHLIPEHLVARSPRHEHDDGGLRQDARTE
ncbi:FAD-dependent monooxygenase [Streptomyces platensis]|uniref:FAD-dependent monooxygenase n=1 Tax=Streptomyces platensis TaxID=58346 RepID=UPI003C2D2CDB